MFGLVASGLCGLNGENSQCGTFDWVIFVTCYKACYLSSGLLFKAANRVWIGRTSTAVDF